MFCYRLHCPLGFLAIIFIMTVSCHTIWLMSHCAVFLMPLKVTSVSDKVHILLRSTCKIFPTVSDGDLCSKDSIISVCILPDSREYVPESSSLLLHSQEVILMDCSLYALTKQYCFPGCHQVVLKSCLRPYPMNPQTYVSTNGADCVAIEGVWGIQDKRYSTTFNCVWKKNSYKDVRNTIRL